MKKLIVCLFALFIVLKLSAQFVAKMELKEEIIGLCSNDDVYSLFPMFDGQKKAVSPLSDSEILAKLNNEVKFLKDNPKYKDKGMISLIINCKGELVQSKMDNETKSLELDKQIETVFAQLLKWKPGKLNGKRVDSVILYSFKIKKGVFVFE